MTTSPAVRVDKLVRRFGEIEAVADASFEIATAEVVALVGPSGCGKTSLLQMIGLLDRPTAGKVWLAGQDVWSSDGQSRSRLRRERIGFVFQQHNLLAHLTARDNVALPAWRNWGSRGRALEAADALLTQLGLAQRAESKASRLSVGEAQRVAIARALVTGPVIVLADEPTGNLDSRATARVLDALTEISRAGAALLVATHDQTVAAWANRTIAMRDGRI